MQQGCMKCYMPHALDESAVALPILESCSTAQELEYVEYRETLVPRWSVFWFVLVCFFFVGGGGGGGQEARLSQEVLWHWALPHELHS